MGNRRFPARRHAFGFDAIMADPDYSRFQDWYARRSFFSPSRHELEGVFSEPEAARNSAA